ncbi:type 4b pilus protein PilO2 [Xenorhabdus bovienii]|uniref:type 4b pilus protein PilO2 n=1 Tax=Xenorhabdus bovienii TaxID=40576 RepID=UPI003DA5EA11
MASESKKIRIVTYNNKQFVIGLEWRAIRGGRNFMKEVKEIGKKENLDVVAIRQNESIQAGFAPKTDIPLRGKYSFAVSLVSLIPGRWIGVFPLNPEDEKSNEYILVATSEGIVLPWTDKIITEDEVEQEVINLKSRLSIDNEELKIYGDSKFIWVTDDISLKEILAAKKLKREFKLKPLTWGLTKKQIYALVALFFAIIFTAYLLNDYMDRQAEKERLLVAERQRIADEINKDARYKAGLLSLKRPWVSQPSISSFIGNCDLKLYELPLSLGGRIPTNIECTSDKAEILYIRLDGSSVGALDFKKSVEKQFSTTPSFNLKQPSVASFFLPLENKPDGDDPLLEMTDQLDKLVTLLQRNNLEFTLTDVPPPEKKLDSDGMELPLPDWNEMIFSYDADIPTRMIFKDIDMSGMRITKISLVVNNHTAEIKYKVQGVIYGKK